MFSKQIQSLKDIYERKDLLVYLTYSKLKTSNQNMVLGYLWWILTPLLWVMVYWFLIVVIFNRGEKDYPLFLACAILPWRSFAISASQSIRSVSSQENLIKQVAFPKGILPITTVLSNSVSLFFAVIILICMTIVYGNIPTINIIYLLFIIIVQLTFTLGLAFMLSIIGLYFSDIQNLMQFILRVWLYLSPSIYSIDRVPEKLQTLYMVNPFAPIFISYRDVIMYNKIPPLEYLLLSECIALATLLVGFYIFSSQEQKLPKIL